MGVFGNTKMKLFVGGDKVKKAYLGDTKIYSAGNIVTYYVDSSTYYQEEVDSGASCLSPTTFTPSKTGWTFVGWREDKTANADILTRKIMADEPITLYAVFIKDITLTAVSNGKSTKYIQKRYYNNLNVANPTFTVYDPTLDEAVFKGWSKSSGSSKVTYTTISNTTFTTDTTIYAVFTYDNVSKTFSLSPGGTFNSGITLANFSSMTITASASSTESNHSGYGWYVYINSVLVASNSNATDVFPGVNITNKTFELSATINYAVKNLYGENIAYGHETLNGTVTYIGKTIVG